MMVHPCDLPLKASFPFAGLAGSGAWRPLAQQREKGVGNRMFSGFGDH